MAFGTSIFLFAAGAILAYAVETDVEGVNLETIGIILMIVGAVGFLLSMLLWASWSPFARDRRYEHDETVVERDGEIVGREYHRRTSA